MKKLTLAESALNRLLNFMDDLEPPVADPTAQGEALDAALTQPAGDVPAVPGMDEALVTKSLGL
jgi:hypothetical protein